MTLNKKGMVLRQHPQDMARYANDTSEKYIPETDVKQEILIKSPRPENLDPVKKPIICRTFRNRKGGHRILLSITPKKRCKTKCSTLWDHCRNWVMVEQVNSGSASGSPSTIEMDTVLELLEKTVLLIGQCNNTITYERRKNVLLGVTGTS